MDNAGTYDAIMGGVWTCPNECRTCADCGSAKAYPGFDDCAACGYQYAVDTMNAEPFSQENQTEVVLWRARLEMERAA
jgi:hypothetical protein